MQELLELDQKKTGLYFMENIVVKDILPLTTEQLDIKVILKKTNKIISYKKEYPCCFFTEIKRRSTDFTCIDQFLEH